MRGSSTHFARPEPGRIVRETRDCASRTRSLAALYFDDVSIEEGGNAGAARDPAMPRIS
jgi:hypothetical protein